MLVRHPGVRQPITGHCEWTLVPIYFQIASYIRAAGKRQVSYLGILRGTSWLIPVRCCPLTGWYKLLLAVIFTCIIAKLARADAEFKIVLILEPFPDKMHVHVALVSLTRLTWHSSRFPIEVRFFFFFKCICSLYDSKFGGARCFLANIWETRVKKTRWFPN
jgi:hypothetical protein